MLKVAVGVLAVATIAASAQAAELSVYTGGSMAAPLKTAGEAFTARTGTRLHFVSGTTGVMLRRIRAGEMVDVAVISAEGLEALVKEGRIAGDSVRPVANALLGVAVKAGAPKPDISSVEKLKAAFLAAKSVSFPDPKLGATSGVYLLKLFDQMGIAEAMKAKTVNQPMGGDVAAAVARGEAELGVTFISEMIPDKGVAIAGTLPEPILAPSPYTAGVATASTETKTARAFIDFITSPAERGVLSAGGLDPAVR